MKSAISISTLSYATIKGIFEPSKKESISKLPTGYKKYLEEKIKKENECKVFIEEIIRYAKVYRKYFLEFTDDSTFNFQNPEKRLFKILESQGITSYHPYILYICERYEDNDEKRKLALDMLERFIVKTQILNDKNETEDPRKNCEQFIEDAKNERGILVKKRCNDISNSRIQEKIKTGVKDNLAKMLLFWIELYRRYKDERHDQDSLRYIYQLEHIMPQKWSEHWRDVHYTNEKGEKIAIPSEAAGSSELYEKREDKIGSLGNMTLLKGKLNDELQNYDFKRKIAGDGRKKGMKEYAELSITRKDIIEEVFDVGLDWNECTIAKRAEKLGKEIVEIWGN